MNRTLCAVSGTRADWGLLRPVLALIRQTPNLHLQLIVTGSHLANGFGDTQNQIAADGFAIDARVDLGLDGDDAPAISHALGTAVSGFGAALARLRPDLLLVLGDRYEILGAVQAATIARIPVAHIAGGDITAGAFDDALRHAISKLSHLHFPTNDPAHRRLLQMGEPAQRIYPCGSPGIDNILATPRLSRTVLEQRLGMPLRRRNLAITFHTATLDTRAADTQLAPLLHALAALDDDHGLIFTGANADPGGATINRLLQDFVAQRPHACLVASLGAQAYYSLVAQADLVIGNSSSGLYEAPSLGTPTVNIGNRQAGRLRGPSVIDCDNQTEAIAQAIHRVLDAPPQNMHNPYGDGNAAPCIVAALAAIDDYAALLNKPFIDLIDAEKTP